MGLQVHVVPYPHGRHEQAQFLGLSDGGHDVVDGHGVFVANIDIALVRADGKGADDHALQNAVRIALHQAAVHKRAGVALVAVADDVLDFVMGLAGGLPLVAGGEASATPAAQARLLHLVDNLLRLHLKQGF